MVYPKIVFIGNLAIDRVYKNSTLFHQHFGGALLYSAIAGSLFFPVGIVSKTGYDFDPSDLLYTQNIDLSGFNILNNNKTTIFNNFLLNSDGSKRNITGDVTDDFIIYPKDIPLSYLKNVSHIHFTTNEPKRIIDIIKYIKKEYSKITISVDTISDYANCKATKMIYNIIDIAFIDEEFSSLLDCNAPIKIVKYGKYGCSYISGFNRYDVKSSLVDNVVDPIGAGDCLNGVFITLLSYGVNPKSALIVANRIATEFVKDYGIMHLLRKEEFLNENKKYMGIAPFKTL